MRVFLLIVALILAGCSSKSSRAEKHRQSYEQHYHLIMDAEKHATPEGRKVLKVTRQMYLDKKIVRGACWDYLNTAYNKAGYPHAKRKRIYFESKRGPYAPTYLLQPGDWIYHINHGYHGVEHSGMFVAWIDRERKIALMLSYAGERRSEPARYKRYDLSSVYSIMRPSD